MSLVVTNLRHVGAVVGGCNAVGFLISAALETHKITDLVGVGSFVAAGLSLTFRNAALLNGKIGSRALAVTADNARVFLVNAGVILWGTRLSTYLFQRVLKLGEDNRLNSFYREKDEKYFDTSRSFYPVKLASFWAIQAAWGFVCMLPVTFLNSIPAGTAAAAVEKLKSSSNVLSLRWRGPVSLLHWLPIATGLAGIAIEAVADFQKTQFRDDPANKGRWCDVGLWKLSRYPNYFGEMLVWWSIWGACAPAITLPQAVVSSISPLFVTALLTKVSGVPLLEAAAEKKYAGNAEYNKYRESTPMFIPSFKKLFTASAARQEKS